MGLLINIDNGGTLTDICVIDGAKVHHTKTITTPYDLSKCFFEGLKKASLALYGEERLVDLLLATDHIRYSTTQGTNAIVEKKGPRLGLILSGAGDTAALTRSAATADMFAVLVGDRVTAIDTGLSGEAFDGALVTAVNRLTNAGANRIVISLDGAGYRADEQRLKRAILRKFPRHLLGVVPVLCASDLVDDVEAERRCWSALINAFLHPAMENFLYNAEAILRDYKHQNPLLIFRNDGDSSRVARTIAVKTYGSGPQGGMEGARALARHYGFKRLLTMDIGGTTTDIGLVEGGVPRARRRGEVENIEISFPLAEIVSVGVGGSSILEVRDGAIAVGPESVGGAPGPACFGLGGTQATITDVFLLTGLIDPATYFGGTMKLDRARAEAAVQAAIAAPLGLDLPAALAAAEHAWVARIADSLIQFTAIDDDTVLAAFGGAGPFVVSAIAEAAGIRRVIIPGLAAVFSAFGIGFSDIAQGYSRVIGSADPAALDEAAADLRRQAARDMFAEGFDIADCRLDWSLSPDPGDGQGPHAWNPGQGLPAALAGAGAIVLELRAVRAINHARLLNGAAPPASPAGVAAARRLALPGLGAAELPVHKLEDQIPGAEAAGPCILEEAFFTARIGRGWRFSVNANRDTLLARDN
ncbi:hydantoinase/oxoprolinase family protein [Zavarzinia compransoris]|uniref:Hydantoinase n=1 Tax=Zavarzinia compransoris TaxID=1264899 RepID=A0A317DTT5_9PROT|nr:hydantoinase/oxoprolinase family protein [Zavarzinia compransoris]PWR17784.1 hydantoinase [Zavarzinia compransoris]TDP49313.1 N-methylhydantoinase A/oxoprolinase/acetone carboxylase beta subunit [Zavarzinia compransoris]